MGAQWFQPWFQAYGGGKSAGGEFLKGAAGGFVKGITDEQEFLSKQALQRERLASQEGIAAGREQRMGVQADASMKRAEASKTRADAYAVWTQRKGESYDRLLALRKEKQEADDAMARGELSVKQYDSQTKRIRVETQKHESVYKKADRFTSKIAKDLATLAGGKTLTEEDKLFQDSKAKTKEAEVKSRVTTNIQLMKGRLPELGMTLEQQQQASAEIDEAFRMGNNAKLIEWERLIEQKLKERGLGVR